MSQDRRFHLEREEDVSGISGTGTVATGVAFQDGTAVLHWLGELSSTAVYPRVGDVITIHGHNGATKLVWDDGGESSQEAEYRLNMTYVENGGKGPWCIHDDCRHWFEPQCDDNCKSVA